MLYPSGRFLIRVGARLARARAWTSHAPTVSLAALALVAVNASAEEAPASVVAVHVKGVVEVQHGTAAATEPVKEGGQLAGADTVTTAAASSVVLVMSNGAVVSLRENTKLKIAKATQTPGTPAAPAATSDGEAHETGVSNSSFELAFGQMLTRVRKLNPASTFEVQTPVSVAAVRGTVFDVSYLPDAAGASAHYCLCTSRGLVDVTPHGSALVKVAAGDQVDFGANLARKRVRIQRVKMTKLDRHKQEQMDKESSDTERSAQAAARGQKDGGADGNTKAARADDGGKERDKDAGDSSRQKGKDGKDGKDGGDDKGKAIAPGKQKTKAGKK